MSVYAVRNRRTTGTAPQINMGGDHSSGVVIVAETLEEAQQILRAHVVSDESGFETKMREGYGETIEGWNPDIEGMELVDIETSGIVLYANGDC